MAVGISVLIGIGIAINEARKPAKKAGAEVVKETVGPGGKEARPVPTALDTAINEQTKSGMPPEAHKPKTDPKGAPEKGAATGEGADMPDIPGQSGNPEKFRTGVVASSAILVINVDRFSTPSLRPALGQAGDGAASPGASILRTQAPAASGLVGTQPRAGAAGGGGLAGGPSDARPRSVSASDDAFMDAAARANSARAIRDDGLLAAGTVAQGAMVPAVLMSRINTDLPGDVVAMVTVDIYDSIKSRMLLIPRGTRIVGRYNADVQSGVPRVSAAFTRLILPNGRSVQLGAMRGVDGQGGSGLEGELDSHFWSMYGASFLVAGLAHLFENSSTNITVNNYGSSGGSVGSAAGQILVDTTKKIMEKDSARRPTITIEPGGKFNIMVQRDIELPPYSGNALSTH